MNDPQSSVESQQYFIRVRGKTLGPFTIEKLRALRARGQFSRVHEFSTDRQSWLPASALEHVFAPARTAPLPPALMESAAPASAAAVTQAQAPAGTTGPGAAWHYNVGGELFGPVSIMELRSLVASGRLQADDYVWKESMPDWVPVAQLPELKTVSGAASPASSGPAPLYDDGLHHTSGFAVASLVMGLVGLITPFLVFNLLAVIFGAVALKAIARSRVALGGRGMALSGLVLGAIGLALWAAFLLFWSGVLALGMR
jgi:hypothetical protein